VVALPGLEVTEVAAAAELGRSAGEADLAKTKPDSSKASDPFLQFYPNVAAWVHDGWIELGRDDVNRSFIRVLDIGGLIWESDKYTTAHQALAAADKAIVRYLAKLG
jgi:hypothetical protein